MRKVRAGASKLTSVLLLIIMLLSFLPVLPATGATQTLSVAFLSEPRLLPRSMISNSTAFNNAVKTDFAMIAESQAILDAAITKLAADRPDVVLVAGNLTKDGEVESHNYLAMKLKQLKELVPNVKIYVINGAKDINNPNAFSYAAPTAVAVQSATPAAFRGIYAGLGYGDSATEYYTPSSGQAGSNSYAARPASGFTVIAIDACKYSSDATSSGTNVQENGGAIPADLLNWVLTKAYEAQDRGDTVITFMNHSVIPHFAGQAQLTRNTIIDNYEEVSAAMAKGGLRYVFTNGGRANDINQIIVEDLTLTDIESCSISAYPSTIRYAAFTKNVDSQSRPTERVEISTKPIQSIAHNGNTISDLTAYGAGKISSEMIINMLVGSGMYDLVDKALDTISATTFTTNGNKTHTGLRALIESRLPTEDEAGKKVSNDIADLVYNAVAGGLPQSEAEAISIPFLGDVYFRASDRSIRIEPRFGDIWISEANFKKYVIDDLFSQFDQQLFKDKTLIHGMIDGTLKGILNMGVYPLPVADGKGGFTKPGNQYTLFDIAKYAYLAHLAGDEQVQPWMLEVLESLSSGPLLDFAIDVLTDQLAVTIDTLLNSITLDAQKLISSNLMGISKKAQIVALIPNTIGGIVKVLGVDINSLLGNINSDLIPPEIQETITSMVTGVFLNYMTNYGYPQDNTAVLLWTGAPGVDIPIDKGPLAAKVSDAAKLIEEEYTEASWNAFTIVYLAAQAVLNKADVTQNEVDGALASLTAAIRDLVKAPVTDYDAEITAVRELIEKIKFGPVPQTELNTEAKAGTYVWGIISALDLNGVLVSLRDDSFTAAIAGTRDLPNGVDGTYIFSINLDKGTGQTQSIEGISLKISASAYDPTGDDNADIAAAKALIEAQEFAALRQEDINTEEGARNYAFGLLNGLALNGVEMLLASEGFTPAVAGTQDNINGVNGAYIFAVRLIKGAGTQLTTELKVVTIIATEYSGVIVEPDLTAAKELVENTAIGPVSMNTLNHVNDARAFVAGIVGGLDLDALCDGFSVDAVVIDMDFQEAVAGTMINHNGMNGYYDYKVMLSVRETDISAEVVTRLVILATPYIPVSKADKLVLSQRLAQADILLITDFPGDKLDAFRVEVEKARAVYNNEDATQEEVDAAVLDLDEAIYVLQSSVVIPVDRSILEALIDTAGKLIADRYTKDSWEAFSEVLSGARAMLENDDATQTAINAMLSELSAAIGLLVKVAPADKAALGYLLSVAEMLSDENYTELSWGEFSSAYAAADNLYYNEPEASQAEVDEAFNRLLLAIGNLEPVSDVDKAVLFATLSQAGYLSARDFTQDTWSFFAAALERGWDVYNDAGAPQSEVNDALIKLYLAIRNLVPEEPVNTTQLGALIDTALVLKDKEADYTADSWNVFSAALTWALDVFDNPVASQDMVDAAAAALEAAISGLVSGGGEVEVVDKSDLIELLDYVLNDLRREEYTPDSIGAVLQWLEIAILARNNQNATQAEVDYAYAKLSEAVGALVKVTAPVDKSALEGLVADAGKLDESKYTMESWAALEAALSAALGILGKEDATEAEVNEAFADLQTAIAGLELAGEQDEVDKTELIALIEYAEGIPDLYTPETWAVLIAKLEIAKAVVADLDATEADVSEALADLQTAIAGLTLAGGDDDEEIDEEDLSELIEYVKRLNEQDYTPGSWAAMEAALNAALEILDKEDATQADVDEAFLALNDALLALVKITPPVNKEALVGLVGTTGSLKAGDYTTVTWAALEAALSAALEILDNNDATQTQVNEAFAALDNAINALVEKIPPANKEALEGLVGTTASLVADEYTAATWSALVNAKTAALGILDKEDATQAQVDSAYAALDSAIKGLVKKPPAVNKIALFEELTKANALIQSEYTAASWSAFVNARTAAQTVYNNPNATQKQVDDATASLANAISKLVKAPTPVNKAQLYAKIQAANALNQADYTKASWDAFQAALRLAETIYASPNAKQEHINAAYDNLSAKMDALVPVKPPGPIKQAINNITEKVKEIIPKVQEALPAIKEAVVKVIDIIKNWRTPQTA